MSFPLHTFQRTLLFFSCIALALQLPLSATTFRSKAPLYLSEPRKLRSILQTSPPTQLLSITARYESTPTISLSSKRFKSYSRAKTKKATSLEPTKINRQSKFPFTSSALAVIKQNTYRTSSHSYWYNPSKILCIILLGSSLGSATYWLRSHPQIKARGYDEGLYSICAFESSMDAFEEASRSDLRQENVTELYYATTHLLFDIQEKIIQCKALSQATGYPLFDPDWHRYKKVRTRAEKLVSQLCKKNSALDPLGDMQELEDAFFSPHNNDKIEDYLKALVRGTLTGVVDAPKNLVEGFAGLVKGTCNTIVWTVQEVVDELGGHTEAKKKIQKYQAKIKAFQKKYEDKGFEKQDNEAIEHLITLVLESYNLMYYLNSYKAEYIDLQKELLQDIRKVREPFFDEFCLDYDRESAFKRYAYAVAKMTPKERIEYASYMVSTIVAQYMLVSFLSDIAGLGNLDKLGQQSLIGRWLSKTRGGRATFKKLAKFHQARRRIQFNLLRKGVKASKVRKAVFKGANGKWETTHEAMSEAAARYQKSITGRSAKQSYRLNGVKFDGFKDGVLLEAKANYKNFINKSGNFRGWFSKGRDSLVKQAERQIAAAGGNLIEWHCQDRELYQALQKIFTEKKLVEIKLIHTPL